MLGALVFLCACSVGKRDSDTAERPCANPTEIAYADGAASGFVRCADGSINRARALPVPTDERLSACRGDEYHNNCNADFTCGGGERCVHEDYVAPDNGCRCAHECATDGDCAVGEACVDPSVAGVPGGPACRPAGCRTDADCAGGECGLGAVDLGRGPHVALVCRSSVDVCRTVEDCYELTDDRYFTYCFVDPDAEAASFSCGLSLETWE